MQNQGRAVLRGATVCLAAPILQLALAGPAAAHVKWFAPYDVAGQPERLAEVFSPLFIELFVLGVLVLWCASAFEATRIGTLVSEAVETIFSGLRLRTDGLIRSGTAVFFIAIWVTGGIILTPELKTTMAATSWLQAAIAIGTFWQSTLVFSGLGIVALFIQGIWTYGSFHMMDYPVFLSVAGYLIVRGLGRETFLGLRAQDLIRWGVAVTLMWASVEKWAYPGWTFPVLHAHPDLSMGLDPKFFMSAAGIMEFSLAFALLWTPLVRRIAAIVLLSMFVSAVFEFGKIDAIGHMLIIVLCVILAADNRPSYKCSLKLAPVWYSTALTATISAYYLGHAYLYGTSIV
jgi:hypothetical protein